MPPMTQKHIFKQGPPAFFIHQRYCDNALLANGLGERFRYSHSLAVKQYVFNNKLALLQSDMPTGNSMVGICNHDIWS